ncbi:MAG: hypothetical protein GWO08_06545, partial [Gammaproteobacteria bacterium]|nr:hypothetical protein [Gammaproteobacteria bacterium]
PIGLNWQKTHGTMAMGTEFATSFVSLNKSNTPSLGCAIIGDTDPGKEFFVEIHSDSVSNLFGIAFELVYSPTTYVKALAVGSGAWMGSDVIFFANIDTTTGVIGIGISRKAGQGGVNGSGMVAKV